MKELENGPMFSLDKQNYRLMVIGCVIVLIGFVLMMGGGSEDPNVFSREIFSPRRITVAPIVVMAGYIFIMYAILKKPKA
jgi:NADH:ubiquinone oxidoreductase subunit 6 (subunit J)